MKNKYILDTDIIIHTCSNQTEEGKTGQGSYIQPAIQTIIDISLENHDLFVTEKTIEELNQHIKRERNGEKKKNIQEVMPALARLKIERGNYPPTVDQIKKQEELIKVGLKEANRNKFTDDVTAIKFINKFNNKKINNLIENNKKLIKENYYENCEKLRYLDDQHDHEESKNRRKKLREEMKKIKFPELIPDIEILMETERNNAILVTSDKSIRYLKHAYGGRPPILEVIP